MGNEKKRGFDELQQPLWRVRLRLFRKSFRENWSIFKGSVLGPIGLGIVIFFAIFAIFYPFYVNIMGSVSGRPSMYEPVTGFAFDIAGTHPHSPTLHHPLGTDPLGRDILTQLMFSASNEFILGLVAAVGGIFIATTLGAISAYYGGLVDTALMRVADIFMVFPFVATIAALSQVVYEMTLFRLALIIAVLSGFGGNVIMLKSGALQVKVKPYIEAAKVAGGSNLYIIFSHIIPNVLPLSFLYMMFAVTGAIFTEATLAFLGLLDVRMSWGIMIQTANDAGYLVGSRLGTFWYLWIPAGLAITFLCAGFYFIGRGLNEVVNPKLRER